MHHRRVIVSRKPYAAQALGCMECELDPGMGFLRSIGRAIAKPFESIGKEIGRAYDKIEDTIKPYLVPIAGMVPIIGGGLAAGVSTYRGIREMKKAEGAELAYLRNDLPRELIQRACTGGMPLDCTAPAVVPPALTSQANVLRAYHSEANYRKLITDEGDSPGPVIESILVKQDADAVAWAQMVAATQQQAQQRPAAGQSLQSMPSWAPWAGVGALALVWAINR